MRLRRLPHWIVRTSALLATLSAGVSIGWAAGSGLRTWNPGDTLTASDLNSNFQVLQSQITNLQSQLHAPSAFHAQNTTGSTTPCAGLIGCTPSVIPFDQKDFDLAGSEYDPTTGLFTTTSGGVYLIECGLESSSTTRGTVVPLLYRSGWGWINDAVGGSAGGGQSLTTWNSSGEVSNIMQLSAGEQVGCGSVNPIVMSTGAQTNFFSAVRLY
jgi:hypothetical protein